MRLRFAPSPTGYLHIGSARTFIFNWLYTRHNGGTMILRTDDTDVGRNTQAALDSIFDGLNWLELGWDEQYRQSERLSLHCEGAAAIAQKGDAYFTPSQADEGEKSHAVGPWLFNQGMRELSAEESARRAADADLRISHIVRGQDHLSNAFKHILIFESLGAELPQVAHLPLLVAPDGAKLSKRKHGPVVSVTTYRDAGVLPRAYINFLCLLGWSPKDNREQMSLSLFTLRDFATRGRAYFSEDFRIEPDALGKLDKPGSRELLRELAGRIAALREFTGHSVEAELRKLAKERGVKAGLLINAARAALTGQSVGPNVFAAIGRDRAIERLGKVQP
jgi:glutamyl-tRNA synthetase